ncbi:hypothetical protein GCM10009785_33590 [Brooklawnia cerclae]|uniref:Uncharacterized protein n=1 Tax=Brooklawnia cerclae TaxID=349934 RepID=A0ABX0SCM8_9ACTN|nr:hypothetical protein [Brooklawnia cerclae]NIH55726.1 hypothetical protein [Brooklawnia cerclae]
MTQAVIPPRWIAEGTDRRALEQALQRLAPYSSRSQARKMAGAAIIRYGSATPEALDWAARQLRVVAALPQHLRGCRNERGGYSDPTAYDAIRNVEITT